MLTRILFKMACMVAISVGGMTYLASTMGKDPLAYFDAVKLVKPDISMPSLPDIPDVSAFTQSSTEKTTVYRWTDHEGGLQFSSSPPPPGTAFKTVKLDPNTNLVKAHPIPEKKTESESGGSSRDGGDEGDSNGSGSRDDRDDSEELPTREDIGDIREQLNELKALNENRINDLNALIGKQK
ncbi:MAG: DUF4124 domain-containing protein [Pseudomonadota bacterium]